LQQIADQNLAALSVLIGRAPEHIVISAQNLAALSHPAIVPGLPSELLARRPDVQSAEAQLASAHANLISARAAFFPQIQLTGSGGFQSLALQSLFSPGAGFTTLAAGLTQPIFDGGVLQGTFQEDKGRQDELLADYQKAIISAFKDVEQALIALRETGREEKLLQQSLKASQTAFDLSEAQLRAGTLDYVTLLQTQQTLFTTQDNLSQVRLARLQAAATLFQALGGGWREQIATERMSE
jgi:outer membrane protein TolC